MSRPLPSTINSTAIMHRVERAARARFPRRKRNVFFEHGHWWLRVAGRGDEEDRDFDVVDAIGGESVEGLDFEEV